MRDFCSYTGIPITQAAVLYPARLSLVHPELDYTVNLSDTAALGYVKSVTKFCDDATGTQDFLSIESALRLLTYRFLYRHHKIADAFRPVLLKTAGVDQKPEMVLACKSLTLLMGLPPGKVLELPLVQHLDRDTPVRLYGIYDNGIDRKLDAELGDLLVFITEKDRIQASLESRVRSFVRVLIEFGTPEQLAVTIGRAWTCDQVASRCSASTAEYNEDNVTMMRIQAGKLMGSEVAGVHVYTYVVQWVDASAGNHVCKEAPSVVSMMRYLARQWSNCRKPLADVLPPAAPVVFVKSALPAGSAFKLKSKLK